MSENWWYADNGSGYGPVAARHLHYMIQAGELDGRDWVWSPGMAAWTPISAISALADKLHAAGSFRRADGGRPIPTMLPTIDRSALASPWRRLWAQLLDKYLIYAFLIALLGLGGHRVESGWENIFCTMAAVLISLVLQACLLATIGTTPGKALLGLRVVRQDGGPIDLRLMARRQWHLWIKGYALGLPVISVFTFMKNKSALDRARPTAWDSIAGTVVHHKSPNPMGPALAVLILIMLKPLAEYLSTHAIRLFGV